LTWKILEDKSHKITKFILYLHTLESFLYKELKHASRNKDEDKIMSLGPYALVLTYILNKSNQIKENERIFVYRGMKMTKQQFSE
jgi:hypothetical protein